MRLFFIYGISLLLISCAGVPDNINPVTNFELERYMGKWYEIVRLDHRFEKELEQVTATYSIQEDGTVKVVNRGFSRENKEWKEATGKAKFAEDPNVGFLKVSFFWPFYGSYVIFDLDKQGYQYSFVTGGEDYLWLLSRTPEVSEAVQNEFLSKAQALGFKTENLIFVRQE